MPRQSYSIFPISLSKKDRRWALQRMKRLYDEGRTDDQIALDLGIPIEAIRSWRLAKGLPSQRQKARREAQSRAERILELYKQNHDQNQIVHELGVPYSEVAIVVGKYLMQLCRKSKKCPYKALLPEKNIESLDDKHRK